MYRKLHKVIESDWKYRIKRTKGFGMSSVPLLWAEWSIYKDGEYPINPSIKPKLGLVNMIRLQWIRDCYLC